jgi:hypothetical protein
VIIVSLIAASLSLPYLLKGLKLPPERLQQEEEEDQARIAAAEAAIQAIEQAQHEMGERRGDTDLYAMLARGSWNSIASISTSVRRPGGKGAGAADGRDRMQAATRRPYSRTNRTLSHCAVPQALGRNSPQTRQGNRSAGGPLRNEMTKLSVSKLVNVRSVFKS